MLLTLVVSVVVRYVIFWGHPIHKLLLREKNQTG